MNLVLVTLGVLRPMTWKWNQGVTAGPGVTKAPVAGRVARRTVAMSSIQ